MSVAKWSTRWVLGGLSGAALLAAACPASAQSSAPPPGSTARAGSAPVNASPGPAPAGQGRGEITISASNQPIGSFLRDLFGRAGRPVVPSPNLTGTVNGVFRGTVPRIWQQIGRAFNLVGYDDGAAYYVYAGNEVTGQTFAVGSVAADRTIRAARSQGLIGGRNRLRVAADGSLAASGVPRFVEQVGAIARGAGSGGGGGRADGGGGYGLGPLAPPAVQPLEFRVFYLRYARAEDTVITAGGREQRLPGLATILQNLVLEQKPGGSAVTPTFGARRVRQSQPRLGGTGLGSVAPDESQTSLLSQPSLSASDILGGDDQGSGGLVAPLSQDVVRIEPSPSLNALIVRDVPERMAAYDGLIRALDVEPQVVEIEATIIDIDNDKLRDLGINYRIGSGGFGALFGNGTDSDNALSPNFGQSRRDNVSAITSSALGGTISTILGGQREFLARITALEQKRAARIVQRPQIVTLANTEAIFDRTQTFYVRVAGRQNVDLFNVTTGTVLRVNPHVFRDHDQTRIRMMINIEDGNIDGDVTVDNIPSIERSSVATQAMIVDGESLLIGGMTADADSNTITKVPLLGNIPLLGELFKFRSRQHAHTERLFLITPRLVSLTTSRSAPPVVPAGAPAR